MIIKKLLVVFVFYLSFITPVFLMSSVSYSKYSNSDLVKLYFSCFKHPSRHFVEYYYPLSSQHINSNNYTNYRAWKDYGFSIIQLDGQVTINNKLLFIKRNNGRTYNNDDKLACYAKNNKIYWSDSEPILYVKNNVLYDKDNNFIASMHKIGSLTSFYDIQDKWLGLRADLSQENLLTTYLAFYYNATDNNGTKILFGIYGVNSNYIFSLYEKDIIFAYADDNNKLESPLLPIGHKDKNSLYTIDNQLVGTFHPKTGLITNYKNVVIGKITKDGYVYGKTKNLLGRIGKFKYNKEKDTYYAPIYNAKNKYIAYILKYYKKTN